MIPATTVANTKDIDDHVSQRNVAYLAWGKRPVLAPLADVFVACKTYCEDLHNPWAILDKTTHYLATIAKKSISNIIRDPAIALPMASHQNL